MNPKTAEELLEMGVGSFLVRELKSAISDEYLYDICHAIREDVLREVKDVWLKKKKLGAMTTLNLPLVVFL